ncbi:hypothetical protein [Bradyrhizobium sp. WSM1253]|uniref:hypothetical protein n=1 Tax=Bradyrhizobium sp. WSM1253 TaxID=319003 RepID=UPI00025D2DF1|nr:hypothetical protein [Bradyrhizobium sp. WSM1253]EIG63479.1 hypothetical protein Bra1253DRAFT_08454 [Bradyrhizobium sp. WSM1253]
MRDIIKSPVDFDMVDRDASRRSFAAVQKLEAAYAKAFSALAAANLPDGEKVSRLNKISDVFDQAGSEIEGLAA